MLIPKPMNEIRLNKYIADSGVSSRRQADELILAGRVRINGEIVRKLGSKVCSDAHVSVDDKLIQPKTKKVYLALYKPKGIISSASDELGRKTIIDLIPSNARLFSVGRLDKDSEGLILLTNDGDFANKLSHPACKVEKIYLLTLNGSKGQLEQVPHQFIEGFMTDGQLMKADRVKLLNKEGDRSIFEVVIHQGYNRQLRKMAAKLSLKVLSLKRIQIGSLIIGNLQPGESRHVSKEEVLGG